MFLIQKDSPPSGKGWRLRGHGGWEAFHWTENVLLQWLCSGGTEQEDLDLVLKEPPSAGGGSCSSNGSGM